MTVETFLPLFISFIIMVVLAPFVIPALTKLKASQTERNIMEEHVKKTGTPTMGGIMIIIAVAVSTLIFGRNESRNYMVLLLTVGFGIIGFIDDYLKVVKRRSDGLLAWQKLILQIIVTTAFLIWFLNTPGCDLSIVIPFTGGYCANIGIIAIPLFYFAVIGTVNGTNFTDGVDGLLGTVTLPVAAFFFVVSAHLSQGVEPVSLAVIGALMGYLLFNCYPAKVFMGDTGSLAIGGFVAGTAYVMNMPLFIIIVGFIYLAEVLSVIIQVSYFKITKGKRIFRMAPIHHHFELGGWSETRVVTVFAVVTAFLCIVGYLAR